MKMIFYLLYQYMFIKLLIEIYPVFFFDNMLKLNIQVIILYFDKFFKYIKFF